jgi:hypothetical protein
MDKLQTVQNAALRIATAHCTGQTKDTNIQYLHDESDETLVLLLDTPTRLLAFQLREKATGDTHPLSCLSCKREIVMAWLRLGHTRITHEHIMTRTDPRTCRYKQCNNRIISVKHLLVECPNFQRAQTKYFGHAPHPLRLFHILDERA